MTLFLAQPPERTLDHSGQLVCCAGSGFAQGRCAMRDRDGLAPFETGRLRVAMPDGVPYQPWTYPVNYTYAVSITSTAGFVPALQSAGSADARLLGAFVRLVPAYHVAR